MSDDRNNVSSGMNAAELLLIVFVALKLCGVINWSWWWVLSPLWIPLGLFVVGGLIFLLISLLKGKGW